MKEPTSIKGKFTEDWFTNHIPIWEKHLSVFRGQPIKGIELGSFEGRSSVWLMDNIFTHKDSKLDCVDLFEGDPNLDLSNIDWQDVEKRFLYNTKKYKNLYLHKKDTVDYLKERTEPADFIYVDANHFASVCIQDAVLSHILLKNEGIIIFDDYLWDGLSIRPAVPKLAIDSFMHCFPDQYKLLHIGYQLILQKAL